MPVHYIIYEVEDVLFGALQTSRQSEYTLCRGIKIKTTYLLPQRKSIGRKRQCGKLAS